MNITTNIKRNILAPICYGLVGNSVLKQKKYEKYLINFEYCERDKVINYQTKKLKELFIHSYKNIPYYRTLFGKLHLDPYKHDSIKILKQLPYLTKDIISADLKLFKLNNYNRCDLRATSGTSGRSLQFYWDRKDEYKHYASDQRFYHYAGYERGVVNAYFWGHAEDFKRARKIKGKVKNFIDNILYFNSYMINEDVMYDYYRKLSNYKEYIIYGFPSSIYFFVKFLFKNNFILYKPITVLTTAEKLYKYQRELIEKYFNCKVFSLYGCQEIGTLGSECECHNGFHLDETHHIFEIEKINSLGQKKGRLVVTSLINYAMPFIRYILDDIGELCSGMCSCGRTSLKLINLEGRVTDFIVDEEENLINFGFFTDIFEFSKGIDKFKIYQKQKGKIDILIVKNMHFDQTELDYILNRIKDLSGDRLNIKYKFVDYIKTSNSGKHQPVKSEIASKYI